MEYDAITGGDNESKILFEWTARKLQPVVLLYVAAVFVALIALSFFVFRSTTAVKALAMTAVAAIVPLVPSVLMRTEYRLTDREIARRSKGAEPPRKFECLVRLGELDRIVPTSSGFKFYKPLYEPKPLKRFWHLHVSDAFSGEVLVEKPDRKQVVKLLADRGVNVL